MSSLAEARPSGEDRGKSGRRTCLSGIKTSPGHLISHANIERKLLKVRRTIAARLDGSALFCRISMI